MAGSGALGSAAAGSVPLGATTAGPGGGRAPAASPPVTELSALGEEVGGNLLQSSHSVPSLLPSGMWNVV
jgi:hypothetical protein